MTIKNQMNDDLKEAMKNKDIMRRDVLRAMLAAIKQVEVDKRTDLDDATIIQVLMTETKKAREAIQDLEKGGRAEEIATRRAEIDIIESYLPRQLSREEIRAEVEAIVKEVGASSAKDKGKVMQVLMPRVKGKADGKLVNEVVSEVLGG